MEWTFWHHDNRERYKRAQSMFDVSITKHWDYLKRSGTDLRVRITPPLPPWGNQSEHIVHLTAGIYLETPVNRTHRQDHWYPSVTERKPHKGHWKNVKPAKVIINQNSENQTDYNSSWKKIVKNIEWKMLHKERRDKETETQIGKILLDNAKASIKEAKTAPDSRRGGKYCRASGVYARLHQPAHPWSSAGESRHEARLQRPLVLWRVSVNEHVVMRIFPSARVREEGPAFTVMSKSEGEGWLQRSGNDSCCSEITHIVLHLCRLVLISVWKKKEIVAKGFF